MTKEEIIEILYGELYADQSGFVLGIEDAAEIIASKFKTLKNQVRDLRIDLEDYQKHEDGW